MGIVASDSPDSHTAGRTELTRSETGGAQFRASGEGRPVVYPSCAHFGGGR